jgi:HK97 family phage major capsid protein
LLPNTNKKLEDAVNQANELEAELNELDARPAPHERKMRFEGSDSALDANKLFMSKHDPQNYDLETLALGRLLLARRGEVLPNAIESQFQSLAERAVKHTLTTGGTGTGAELTDTIMWPKLFDDVVSKTLVAGLFTPWLDMTGKSMELPSLGDVTFYKPAGEGEAVTATDLATAKRTITAYVLKAQVDVSDEENEDAIIALLPEIRGKLRRNASEAIDDAILNADTTTGTSNINYYGGSIGSTSRFLLGFDGLIHYPLIEVTGQATSIGALGTSSFATLIGLLGKYADEPSRCAFIVDRWVKNKAIQLDDFRTLDKLGAQATLLTGQIGQIYGIPTVLSSQIAKSHASGYVHYSTGNTLGRILLVNRDMWKFGVRRNITIATERSEAKGLTSIVVTMRLGLQCFGDRTSAQYCHTALGYNTTI